jgi:GT2 family glycosyltransferase
MKKTVIIILNWNGADDTLACLESMLVLKGNFHALVVDNGSGDDSVERIGQWIAAHKDEISSEILPLDKNYGFAIGNNKGVAYARKYNPDYFLLLNNDTEVTPDFLKKLVEFSEHHSDYRVLTPKIHYFFDKSKIWNCGGSLSMGFRRYYYAGQCDADIKESVYIPIGFVTGCALFFPPELLDCEGRLLTERFFFGEEDFEFSMRMEAQGVKMACVLDSVIYHKVGASGSRMSGLGKIYLHYLNRFVDIRLHKSRIFYYLWALVNAPFCIRHFYKGSHSFSVAAKLLWRLLSDARVKQGVSREDFESLVINNTYFDK